MKHGPRALVAASCVALAGAVGASCSTDVLLGGQSTGGGSSSTATIASSSMMSSSTGMDNSCKSCGEPCEYQICNGQMCEVFMGLFNQTQSMISYVMTPVPGSLAATWFCAGIVQAVLLGIVTYLVYKPKAAVADVTG